MARHWSGMREQNFCPTSGRSFHALSVTNPQHLTNKIHNIFLRYLYYNITPNIRTGFDLQGIIIG
jgi:hypothetical protein